MASPSAYDGGKKLFQVEPKQIRDKFTQVSVWKMTNCYEKNCYSWFIFLSWYPIWSNQEQESCAKCWEWLVYFELEVSDVTRSWQNGQNFYFVLLEFLKSLWRHVSFILNGVGKNTILRKFRWFYRTVEKIRFWELITCLLDYYF